MKINRSFKTRSSASFFKAIFSLPSAHKSLWLGLAIFAVGAFGNSVQAQWLDENFNSLGAGVNLTVGGNCVAAGTAGYATGAAGGGALKITKAVGVAGTEARWTLSDTSYSTVNARPSGYITFKIQQTPGVTSSDKGQLNFRLGANDVNNVSGQPTTWFELRFVNLAYTTAAVGSTTANLKITGNQGVGNQGQLSLDYATSPIQIRVWYTTGSGISYAHPETGATLQLNANSFVVYAGNSQVSTGATGSPLGTQVTTATGVTASTVGKIGFVTGTSLSSDFIIDEIYAGASAPASGVGITSATTATAQAGYPFSYTIRSSGVTSPAYSASPLPSGLSSANVNSSTGVISGTLDANATSTTIELTATGTGGPATANLVLTVTQAPTVVPSFTSTGTAPGFLTKNFSYSIRATVNETTPLSIPTSYAIGLTTPLPAGLSLDASTGIIGGIPTATGVTTVTYTATNPFGTSSPQTLTITINPAPVFTWNNTGTAWTNAASWTNNAIPANSAAGDIAAFGNVGGSPTTVDVGTGRSIGGIVFNSGAYAYTWTGTDIIVGSTGSITNNSAVIQTFGNKVSSSGDGTWSSVSGGSLVFNGGIDLSATGVSRKLTIAGAGNVTVNGVIANGGSSLAGQVYKSGTGTLMLNGTNTYTGATEVVDGTMILSAPNSSTSYKLGGYDIDIFPVLKVSATNALSPSATLAGSSSSSKTGTLEFTTNGNYTLNQYAGNNMNFSNSSGSATTLTFTNATNVLSTGGGRTFANQSANLTITFNGEVDIAGNTNNTCTISAVGPVVISNRVFNSNTNFIRNLEKLQTGNLTMYGVNRYNGSTIVSRGTLSIPTGGSLINCSNTVVGNTDEVASANSASLNLAGAAGVVQVSTNGFVRGYSSESTTSLGTITSLQVQDAGTVEVAVESTWTTDGTIDFAEGSKVSVTGTPITGNTYTLMTASAPITFITGSPTLVGATGWSLRVTGSSLYLEETSVTDGFADYLLSIGLVGTAFDAKVDGVTVGLKYAFNSANGMPQNDGVTAVPVILQLPNGDQEMTYTFDVKGDFFDVNYPSRTVTYQTSSDLVNWAPTPALEVRDGTGSSPTGFLKKQVKVTGSDRVFIRIIVTR